MQASRFNSPISEDAGSCLLPASRFGIKFTPAPWPCAVWLTPASPAAPPTSPWASSAPAAWVFVLWMHQPVSAAGVPYLMFPPPGMHRPLVCQPGLSLSSRSLPRYYLLSWRAASPSQPFSWLVALTALSPLCSLACLHLCFLSPPQELKLLSIWFTAGLSAAETVPGP